MMLALEWWAFEIMAFLGGYIGVTEQASQFVLINVNALFVQLPLGLSSAAATTIGMVIGAGRIDRAKSYYKVNL